MAARKPGRPVSTGRGHAGPRVTVRLSPRELELLERVAGDRHWSVPTYVRMVVLAQAEQDDAEPQGPS
jgi:hypothetical protein